MWKGSMGGRVQSSRMEGMRLEIEELMLRLWIQQVELAALPPKPRLAGRCSWRRSLQLDWNIRRLCACPPLCQGPDLLITALQLWQPGDLDLTAIVSPSPWTGMLLPGIMLRSLLTKREVTLPALRANTIRVNRYLPHSSAITWGPSPSVAPSTKWSTRGPSPSVLPSTRLSNRDSSPVPSGQR